MATDIDTEETIGELLEAGQTLLVAQGGFHGIGNLRFKSSTNRAPRQFKPGTPGEIRNLRLELKIIADVGLLGTPNAGKSTLVRSISAAHPKVADYPFTTLHPHLGVVRVDPLSSFVIADIPGLIEGAADGAGLGSRFLKHLSRTTLLLHLVDVAPSSDSNDPVRDIRVITAELAEYSKEMALRERWIVLNKIDSIPAETREERLQEVLSNLHCKNRKFCISALTGEGVPELTHAVMEHIESQTQRTVP